MIPIINPNATCIIPKYSAMMIKSVRFDPTLWNGNVSVMPKGKVALGPYP